MGTGSTRRHNLMRRDPRARPCHLGQRRRTNQREDRSSLSRKIKEKVNGVTIQHKISSHDYNVHLNLQFISFRLYMEFIQFIFWLYMEFIQFIFWLYMESIQFIFWL